MKPRFWIPLCALLVLASSLAAHDLFLKPERFFVESNARIRIRVLNGTFSKSEGAVARARLRDLSIITPEGRAPLDTTAWEPQGDTTMLSLQTGAPGTYVVAASLHPRFIRLEAKDFNNYLEHDGLPDMLAERRRRGQLDRPARERYSKHVKAVLQAGAPRTAGYETVLGHPAELVPLDNPYSVRTGEVLRVRALVEGQPVPGQYVVAGGRTAAGGRIMQQGVRTDQEGVARIPIRTRGEWYVKFIYMEPVREDSVDYESKWATLTFGIR